MIFSEADISLLQNGAFLSGVSSLPQVDRALRDPANQLIFPAGSSIVENGVVSPGLYLVVHGIVELLAVGDDGQGKVVDFVRTGGMFGEETLFESQPLLYGASALSATALLHLSEEIVSEWLTASPELSRRLISRLAERTDYLQKDIVSFCTKGATARFVCYLVCQFNEIPRTPDVSLTLAITIPRSKLASRLGITSSHLSRVFKELESHDLIVRQRNGIFIPNVQALSNYVCKAGCDW